MRLDPLSVEPSEGKSRLKAPTSQPKQVILKSQANCLCRNASASSNLMRAGMAFNAKKVIFLQESTRRLRVGGLQLRDVIQNDLFSQNVRDTKVRSPVSNGTPMFAKGKSRRYLELGTNRARVKPN